MDGFSAGSTTASPYLRTYPRSASGIYNDTVFAFEMITYSTGQTRGWVIMEIKPDHKVRSFTSVQG